MKDVYARPTNASGPSNSRLAMPSEELLEAHVVTLHKVLYGAEGSFDLNDAVEFMHLYFEDDMRYENPLVSVHGKQALMKQLYLFSNLPGQATDELEEIHQRQERFGTISFVFTHTYTWSLFGLDQLDYPSGHTTATSIRPSSTASSPTSPFLRARLHIVARTRRFGFFSDLLENCGPTAMAHHLTSLSVKVRTHVVFNEQARVVLLEDDVSIRDFIESLPIVGYIYKLQRRAFAASIGVVSNWLVSATAPLQNTPAPLPTNDGPEDASQGLGLQLCPDK